MNGARIRQARLLLAGLGVLFIGGTIRAYDSYDIGVPPNVMKGDPNVTFTITPYLGAVPDPVPHNVYISLPAGVLESPLADPPGGLDWSSVVAWGLFANNAVAPGNTPLTVTEAFAGVPVTTTKFFNLQNVVRSFEIVPPAAFTGDAGVDFQITIRARDGLGGGGSLVTGFNDSVIVSASTGDVLVNGAGNIVNGSDFINGEAIVNIALRGTDPATRTNRIIVTASINYFGLGLATGFADVNINPGPYDHIVLLFPGETLTPGRILTSKVGAATAATANVAVPNVVAYLVDQFNNPIITPLAPVTLLSESLSYPGFPRPPNDTVPALKVINVGNNVLLGGEFVFYKANEVHQVRVYDQADPGKNSVTGIFVNSGAPSLIRFFPVGSPQLPGQSFLVSAEVVDGTPANNRVVSYNNPAVALALGTCGGANFPNGAVDGAPLTAGIQTTVPFVAGLFNGPLRVYPKANNVCLKLDDGAGRFGESNPFQILNGAVLQLHVVMPGQAFTPGLYPGVAPAAPTPQAVGALITAEVYVVDEGWNVVDSLTGGWAPGPVVVSLEDGAGNPGYVDLTLPSPAMPASGAFASAAGVRLRTAYPAGDGRVVARMGGLTGRSSAMTINPRPYNQLVFVAPGETLAPGIQPAIEPDGKLGLPTGQSVNINFPIGVYLTDDYFNPIINPPVAGAWPPLTFSLVSPVGGVVSFPFANPFAMTDSSFNNQMMLGTLGANVVRVVDSVGHVINQTINVEPGAVERFVVTPNPLSNLPDPIPFQTAGVPFSLTFKAFDQFNNLAVNFGGDVSLELWEAGAPLAYGGVISPSTVTFVPDPVTGGYVTTPITVTYAGPSLGLGVDQLQIRAFISSPTVKEGFSANFSVQEAATWDGLVVTLPGETRRPGLGLGALKTGMPTPTPAGNSIPVTVTAVDLYGNKVNRNAVADLSMITAGIAASLGIPPQVSLNLGEGVGFIQVYTAGSSVLEASTALNGFSNRSTMTITTGSYGAGTGRLVLVAPGEIFLPGSNAPPGKNVAGISPVQANSLTSVILYACDRFYNVDTSYSANTFSLTSDDGTISRSNIAVVSGSATVSNLFLRGHLPNPPTVRVTATDQLNLLKTSFSDVPVTPGAYYDITTPATAVVGSTFSMTVRLLDPVTGNPLPVNDSFFMEAVTSLGGPATVPIGTALGTLLNGVATFDQVYGHVELIKIRVTDSYLREKDSAAVDVLPNGLKYKVTLPPAAKTTDDIFPVTVGLYDIIQDALPIYDSRYQHTFNLWVEAGGLPAQGSVPVNTATLTNGESTFNFSYTKAEHIVVRASGTVGAFPPVTGLDDMDINPGAYVKLHLVAPGETPWPGIPSLTGKTGAVTAQAARETFSMPVYAVDRYWNVVTSLNTALNPAIRLVASDGSLAAVPLQGFANGVANFPGLALNTPPLVTITAQDTLNNSIFPQSVTVPITGRVYLATATPIAADFYSGSDFQVDVSLYRFDGVSTTSLVNGFTGPVTIEPLTWGLEPLPAGNLVITNPAPADPAHPEIFNMAPGGVLTLNVNYKVAENVILRFVDAGGWQGYSNRIRFVPRDVNYVITVPATTRVGPPDTFTMTIEPRDSDTGTIAKNFTSTITITALQQATGLPGTGILQVNSATIDGGSVSFPQAYTQSGVFKFRVDDSTRIADSGPVNFLPGPLASLLTNLPAFMEAGTAQIVDVTLRDSFGNPIPNLSAGFSISNGGLGFLSTASGVTNATGTASTLLTVYPQSAGASDFVAASGNAAVRQAFRVLGPPQISVDPQGRGTILDGKPAIKPDDPIALDVVVDATMTLNFVQYRVDGGPWQAYIPGATFLISTVGVHTVDYYGEATSPFGAVHTGSPISVTVNVSRPTEPSEGLMNYPNPFRAGTDVTFLEYNLPTAAGVRVVIYDMVGNKVYETSVVEGELGGRAGLNRIGWDGRNSSGMVVGNGGYVAVLDGGGATLKRKIAVRK